MRGKKASRSRMIFDVSDKVQLHHITYERLGRELHSDIRQLCRPHHEIIHKLLKERHLSIWKSTDLIRELAKPKTIYKPIKKPKKSRNQLKIDKRCRGQMTNIIAVLKDMPEIRDGIMATAEHALSRLDLTELRQINKNLIVRQQNGKRCYQAAIKRNEKKIASYCENERKEIKKKHKHVKTPSAPKRPIMPHASENGECEATAINRFFAKFARSPIPKRLMKGENNKIAKKLKMMERLRRNLQSASVKGRVVTKPTAQLQNLGNTVKTLETHASPVEAQGLSNCYQGKSEPFQPGQSADKP